MFVLFKLITVKVLLLDLIFTQGITCYWHGAITPTMVIGVRLSTITSDVFQLRKPIRYNPVMDGKAVQWSKTLFGP